MLAATDLLRVVANARSARPVSTTGCAITNTVYTWSAFGTYVERQGANCRVDGTVCWISDDKVVIVISYLGRRSGIPFTELLPPRLGLPPPSQRSTLYGGRLLGLIFCFDTRMVAFWLRDDSGRLDTILISPFVTRALESYHMGFGRNGGGVLWSSLMMDCTWYVSGPAFRLRPSLNAAGLRFRFRLHGTSHQRGRTDGAPDVR